MNFYLDGKASGWINTGIRIKANKMMKVVATGKIGFAFGGWNLGPDGRYADGTCQYPARNFDGAWGKHPAGDFIANSLVYRVGTFMTAQGGNVSYSYNNYEDTLYVTNNDNYTGDNSGGWNIEVLTGMYCKCLVILQDLRTDESKAISDVNWFVNTVFNNTVKITVEPDFVSVKTPLRPAQYYHFVKEGPWVGMIDAQLHNELIRMGKDPLRYHSVLFLYKHDDKKYPRTFTSGSYLIGNTFGSPLMYKGIADSAMLMSSIPDVNKPGTQHMRSTILHEFLHQVDAQFDRTGIKGFANPDDWKKNTIPPGASMEDYYVNCLQMMLDKTPPPYYRLDGKLVYFKG